MKTRAACIFYTVAHDLRAILFFFTATPAIFYRPDIILINLLGRAGLLGERERERERGRDREKAVALVRAACTIH